MGLLEFRQAERSDVALNEELYFQFTRPLDRASINRGTVEVTDLAGTPVSGEFLTRDPRMVVFVPDLPTAPDFSDGGFRPGTRYRVTLAGFPRVDGIRSKTGEILSQSLVFWFETASQEEGEPLFFGFPAGVARLDLDPEAHGPLDELGTLEPVRLVVDEGVDPSTLDPEDFALESRVAPTAPVDLEVALVENTRERAVLELLPRRDGSRVALTAGEYILVCGTSSGREARMELRTLGGAAVVPAWGFRERHLFVRDRSGELRLDFTQTDRLYSGRPEGSDGTAWWGGGGGGVTVRYPAAAGDGRLGTLELGTRDPVHPEHPEWRVRHRPGAEIEIPAEGLDLHASSLSITDGTKLVLVGDGLCILRSQGSLVIRGQLVRQKGVARPPAEPRGELEELARRPPAERPTLSDWLGAPHRGGEPVTVLVAGGELEIHGQVDVEGTLILVAGGEVRGPGIVDSARTWQTPNTTLVPPLEGSSELPLVIDPPAENLLREPLLFSVQSRFFGVPGGVSAWGAASFDGEDGTGSWQVSFFGQRLRGGVLEGFGPMASLDALEDCQKIAFRVDLRIDPAPGEPWEPPALEGLRLSWHQPPRRGSGP